ncbi:MAG TPA: MarR family transcriptional regulator [Streptosporangiaceae bacterium]
MEEEAGPAPAGLPAGLAFLLVQIGFQAGRQFGERLSPLGLEQRQAGMLIRLAVSEGESQQAIADLLGLTATRMVFLVDELEALGLVERRRNPADRRSHALYLTTAGRRMLARVRAVVSEHEAELAAGLTSGERDQLVTLLRRIAQAQGLTAQGLPGMPPAAAAGPPAGCPGPSAAGS